MIRVKVMSLPIITIMPIIMRDLLGSLQIQSKRAMFHFRVKLTGVYYGAVDGHALRIPLDKGCLDIGAHHDLMKMANGTALGTDRTR
jgi:hypothetical protein